MPKRRRTQDPDDELVGQADCALCRSDEPGNVYQFWSGFREKHREDRLYGKTQIRMTYSDLKPFNVFVCDACVRGLQRKLYRPHVLGWSLVAIPSAVTVACIPLFQMDRGSSLVCAGLFGLLAVPSLVMLAFRLWQMFRPVPAPGVSDATDRLVLTEVRTKAKKHQKGYDYFTSAEYDDLMTQKVDD